MSNKYIFIPIVLFALSSLTFCASQRRFSLILFDKNGADVCGGVFLSKWHILALTECEEALNGAAKWTIFQVYSNRNARKSLLSRVKFRVRFRNEEIILMKLQRPIRKIRDVLLLSDDPRIIPNNSFLSSLNIQTKYSASFCANSSSCSGNGLNSVHGWPIVTNSKLTHLWSTNNVHLVPDVASISSAIASDLTDSLPQSELVLTQYHGKCIPAAENVMLSDDSENRTMVQSLEAKVMAKTDQIANLEAFLQRKDEQINNLKILLANRERIFSPIATNSGHCDTGVKGSKGDKGAPGGTGPKGRAGFKGLPGPAGGRGPRGQDGHRGLPGEKGEPGLIGDKGAAGSKGNRGFVGAQGIPGHRGSPGGPGMAGKTGQRGDAGIPGSPGPMGRPGLEGAMGRRGALGKPGPPGEEGAQGHPGQPGSRGKPGLPGKIGQPVN